MTRDHDRSVATVPGVESDSPYPLQYLFVLHGAGGRAWLHPGLDANLSNQPYYVIRDERAQEGTWTSV